MQRIRFFYSVYRENAENFLLLLLIREILRLRRLLTVRKTLLGHGLLTVRKTLLGHGLLTVRETLLGHGLLSVREALLGQGLLSVRKALLHGRHRELITAGRAERCPDRHGISALRTADDSVQTVIFLYGPVQMFRQLVDPGDDRIVIRLRCFRILFLVIEHGAHLMQAAVGLRLHIPDVIFELGRLGGIPCGFRDLISRLGDFIS